MLSDNEKYNQHVKANTAFLDELKEKLSEFFTREGSFDLEKFKAELKEKNVNELSEGYQLNFIGKDYARRQAGEMPGTVIVPDEVQNNGEGKDSKNLFFTGDNLEVLQHLQNNYQGKIDVIYIDPPYNTGNGDFVYPDNFEYSDEQLSTMLGLDDDQIERLKSIQGKSSHSAWLTFMYPRLVLAKRLLLKDGVIFISIDDNELSNLIQLMNEVFGESNFRNTIMVRRYDKNLNQQFINNGLASMNTGLEYIVMYSKVPTTLFNPSFRKASNERSKKGYWKGFWNGADRPTMRYTLLGVHPNEGQWKWKKEIAEKAVHNFKVYEKNYSKIMSLEEYWKKTGQTKKFVRRNESGKGKNQGVEHWVAPTDRILRTTNWSDLLISKSAGEGIPFSNPKNPEVIKKLIDISKVGKSGLVLDFFAGSSTTADAVMQLNAEDGGHRKFIMVQLPEKTYHTNKDGKEVPTKGGRAAYDAGFKSIDEISRERIRRAAKKIRENNELTLPEDFDGSFKHYRVVKPVKQTLEEIYDFDPDNTNLFTDMVGGFSSKALGIAGDASGEETILTTWLAKDGYSFDADVQNIKFGSYTAHKVEDNRLYLINEGWGSENTKELLNKLGTHQLEVQSVVIFGYSFNVAELRELENGLKQIDSKVTLIKRY